jgi:hypothetical protein
MGIITAGITHQPVSQVALPHLPVRQAVLLLQPVPQAEPRHRTGNPAELRHQPVSQAELHRRIVSLRPHPPASQPDHPDHPVNHQTIPPSNPDHLRQVHHAPGVAEAMVAEEVIVVAPGEAEVIVAAAREAAVAEAGDDK